ncbi:hypothetical protein ACWDTI_08725 [Gordonia sp. NPDC003424]
MGIGNLIGDAITFIGGRLDGESHSTGNGYSGHVDLVGSKIAPDPTRLVSFRNGGVIGESRAHANAQRADGSRAKLAALQQRGGGPSGPGRRQGGADAPTRRGTATTHAHQGGGSRSRPAHGIGDGLVLAPGIGMGGRGGGGGRRRPDEVAPGVPCPSCASGITVPVR